MRIHKEFVVYVKSEVNQLYETKFDINKIIPMPEPLQIDDNGDETK